MIDAIRELAERWCQSGSLILGLWCLLLPACAGVDEVSSGPAAAETGCTASSGLHFRAIFADPLGVDAGREWSALGNGGAAAAPLAGLTLEVGQGRRKKSWQLPEDVAPLVVGGWQLLAGASVAAGASATSPLSLADFLLPNKSGYLKLLCGEHVAAQIDYGAGSTVPQPRPGHSLLLDRRWQPAVWCHTGPEPDPEALCFAACKGLPGAPSVILSPGEGAGVAAEGPGAGSNGEGTGQAEGEIATAAADESRPGLFWPEDGSLQLLEVRAGKGKAQPAEVVLGSQHEGWLRLDGLVLRQAVVGMRVRQWRLLSVACPLLAPGAVVRLQLGAGPAGGHAADDAAAGRDPDGGVGLRGPLASRQAGGWSLEAEGKSVDRVDVPPLRPLERWRRLRPS